MSEKNSNASASFISHLSELRSRLLRSSVFFLIAFILSYIFAENIYSYLVKPYSDAIIENDLDRRLIFTALHEAFLTYLKVAFFSAIFITSPIFLTEIWKFVAPGLYKNEKKTLLPYLIATPLLFFFGGILVYYFIMPLAIKFFLSFETTANPEMIAMQLEAKVNEYLSLIMRLIFAFGISFQLPVVLSLLARIGVVNSEYLKKRRKYVVVIMFVAAAILTPPDPITQIGLALPLLLLYELSILTVKLIEKKENA
ncbi:MAG: twin-arginine translocase subunit TatC [Pelagibacteraceae bacterium TMED216]|nr:MAG: twin-arginine translocase subunit TatC [Pelagibacteraceae bacterium TMED216]|tara:strand:+ start:472 stop:1236 length:765 start_codon:yes stop_codon:yes gene_type:complete